MEPHFIELSESLGKGGMLSFIEEGELLPFRVRRIYWTYGIDHEVHRGNHCHLESHRVIVCVHGSMSVEIKSIDNEVYNFELSKPNQAVYFPPRHWIDMKCESGTVMVVLASHLYEEDHLITDYDDFLALGQL